MLAGTTSGTGGSSGIPCGSPDRDPGPGMESDAASVISSATKFLFCCASTRAWARGRALVATQWPPHGWVGDRRQSTLQRPTITRGAQVVGGSAPKTAPQRPGTGPDSPFQGVLQLPI